MNAIGFFYSWSEDRKLDAYFGQFAQAFAKRGIRLHIVLANYLNKPNGGGVRSWNPLASEDKLIAWAKSLKPEFVFTLNNAGMTRALRESLTCPVICWMVDDLQHAFMHDGSDSLDRLFDPDDQVFAYTSTLTNELNRRYPYLKQAVRILPHATEPEVFNKATSTRKHGISFVGSCLEYRAFASYLARAHQEGMPEAAAAMMGASELMDADYNADFKAYIDSQPALLHALEKWQLHWLDFKLHTADLITTQRRMQGIHRLSGLDVALYGNGRWTDSVSQTMDIMKCFQFGATISDYDQLIDVYQGSKISVNISNVQNVDGLPSRVFDVMASSSLLITEHSPTSDLFLLFGKDCPVPMYRDHEHLRELCEYFLEHEDERLETVRRCNALVARGFTFDDWLQRMFEFSSIPLPARFQGELVAVPIRTFYGLPRRLSKARAWLRQHCLLVLHRFSQKIIRWL